MGSPRPAAGDRCVARGGVFVARLSQRALVIAMVVALFASALPPGATAQDAALIAADVLNLRAEPGTWSWVVTQMWGGETVAVVGGPTADGWYQVRYGELYGWAYGGYLTINGAPGWAPWSEPPADPWAASAGDQAVLDPSLAPPPPLVPELPEVAPVELAVGGPVGTAWVTTDGLNVRAAPTDDAGILDVAAFGDAVTVLGGAVGGYVPVEHWSGLAWVWGEFLSYAGPPGLDRWVDVNRTTQLVTLYEGDEPVATYWAAMGTDASDDGFFATAVGTYYIYEKYEDLSWSDWGGAWVRNWVAFDPSRLNGFHSFSMDAAGQVIPGGDGPTGGCVALAPDAAAHLFSFVSLGTRVEVHR